ncbi:Uma2 family endonuclease [Streptomyces sp. SKN60]|uniref:Uma2 family endonuclease n=1 Tax=Streptomyces sp. SKN60 TaxID=2855506 RepID=UPI0022485CA1|nr:Uma2 family endonuclease [Streptomyces sp. SKN60]MCX2183399.1 Uma2 family endonuclease [Streptomyces sp. SKN60]
MADLTPEQMHRLHDFAEQLAELAEHQEDQWKVQTTDGQIFLTMMSPTAPHGLNVVRLRRQIEAQTPEVIALNDTNMGDPVTGLTKVPDLMVIAEEDTDDTAKSINSRDVLMVVEVVSRSDSLTDIRDKLCDYPKMGVPLYVVVDPRKDKRTVTVHSDPSQGPDGIRYRKEVPYAFGDSVTAGRWTLDTTGLKSYPADW